MGSTIDEALRNAREALEDWIDSMEEARQPIDAPSAAADIQVPADSRLVSITLVEDSPDKQVVSRTG